MLATAFYTFLGFALGGIVACFLLYWLLISPFHLYYYLLRKRHRR